MRNNYRRASIPGYGYVGGGQDKIHRVCIGRHLSRSDTILRDGAYLIGRYAIPEGIIVCGAALVNDAVSDRVLLAVFVEAVIRGVDVEVRRTSNVGDEVGENFLCSVVMAPIPLPDVIDVDAVRAVRHRPAVVLDAVELDTAVLGVGRLVCRCGGRLVPRRYNPGHLELPPAGGARSSKQQGILHEADHDPQSSVSIDSKGRSRSTGRVPDSLFPSPSDSTIADVVERAGSRLQ
jgi:hypothetical protein